MRGAYSSRNRDQAASGSPEWNCWRIWPRGLSGISYLLWWPAATQRGRRAQAAVGRPGEIWVSRPGRGGEVKSTSAASARRKEGNLRLLTAARRVRRWVPVETAGFYSHCAALTTSKCTDSTIYRPSGAFNVRDSNAKCGRGRCVSADQ